VARFLTRFERQAGHTREVTIVERAENELARLRVLV
jgi:hypothetical protein